MADSLCSAVSIETLAPMRVTCYRAAKRREVHRGGTEEEEKRRKERKDKKFKMIRAVATARIILNFLFRDL